MPGTGVIVCFIWYSLVDTYKDLNMAKFAVIRELENPLPVALGTLGGRGRLPRSPAPSERSVRAGLQDAPHRDAERDKLLFCLLVMASVIRPRRVAKSRSSAAYTSLASGSALVAMISQMIE
jgi:hypothetical protein